MENKKRKSLYKALVLANKKRLRSTQVSDKIATVFFLAMGPAAFVILFLIFFYLVKDALPFFFQKDISHTFFSFNWKPISFQHQSFGILSMFLSTVLLTVGAMAIASPAGIIVSIVIAFYLPPKLKFLFRALVELFSAIPSVIIGLIGIAILAPLLTGFFHWSNGYNAYTACLLIGLMSLATIVNLSLDSLEAVPHNIRLASLGLGASKIETVFKVILPAAKSGVLTAVMLGMGRVVGETMIVLMVGGNSTAVPTGFHSAIRTFTSTIAIEMGEVSHMSTHYHALFALAFILFIFTFFINLIVDKIMIQSK